MLPGADYSAGRAIAAIGWVIGVSGTENGSFSHAFLWDGTTMKDLGGLGEGDKTDALAINNCGDVVGTSSLAGGFLYTQGTMFSLGSLLTANSGFNHLRPLAINDHGEIIGTYVPGNSNVAGNATDNTARLFIMTPVTPEDCDGDLAMTNTAPAVINPGEDILNTIRLKNLDSSITQMAITDGTISQTTIPSCSVTGGGNSSCNGAGNSQRIYAFLPDLEKGATATAIARVHPVPSSFGDFNLIENFAGVGTALGGVEADTAVTVREKADLSIAASLSTSQPDQLHYVLNLANAGPNNSHAVLVLDPLPAGTTFVSASTTMGDCTYHSTLGPNGSVRCRVGNMPYLGTAHIDIVLQLGSDVGSAVTNTATVSTQSIDVFPGNNSSSTVTAVHPQKPTDLAITNQPDASVIGWGADLGYKIQVKNLGPSATPVVVTDTLDRTTELVSCQVSSGEPCAYTFHRLSINLQNFASKSTATIIVHVKAAEKYGDYNQIINTASVNSSNSDPAPGNNSATAVTTVRETADLSIVASSVIYQGDLIIYYYKVVNHGPDDSHAVLMVDPLPAGTTYGGTSVNDDCSFHPTLGPNGSIRCRVGNLPAHGTTEIVVYIGGVGSKSGSTVTNTATVTTQSIDPNASNNSSTVVTTVHK